MGGNYWIIAELLIKAIDVIDPSKLFPVKVLHYAVYLVAVWCYLMQWLMNTKRLAFCILSCILTVLAIRSCSHLQLDQFVVRDLQNALSLDSLNSSHPIITGATDPDEINSLFDSISYDKVWLLWQPVCMCQVILLLSCIFGFMLWF